MARGGCLVHSAGTVQAHMLREPRVTLRGNTDYPSWTIFSILYTDLGR